MIPARGPVKNTGDAYFIGFFRPAIADEISGRFS